MLRRALLALVLAIIATAIVLIGSQRLRVARVADLHEHAASMTISASGFGGGGDIPTQFTCRGASDSPELAWSGAPVGTKSYVIVMRDDDVPHPLFSIATFTHWLLYNIPVSRTSIAAKVPAQALADAQIEVGQNSDQADGYFAPCPPMGRHIYTVSIYAIDLAHITPSSNDADALFDVIKGHVLGYGEVSGAMS